MVAKKNQRNHEQAAAHRQLLGEMHCHLIVVGRQASCTQHLLQADLALRAHGPATVVTQTDSVGRRMIYALHRTIPPEAPVGETDTGLT